MGVAAGNIESLPDCLNIDAIRSYLHIASMIVGFADKETEKLWQGQRSRKLPAEIQQRALNKLAMLNRSRDINDLRVPPSNHLERLSGDRAGKYSIRINQQWRICFRWSSGRANDVEITDYH
ncbi:MAG TPA: type II toxin-antitoxin system RelE/ParE family toxin [Opitutales bacterium]|nr:type II toxin-antitoxin system RelE/ParE family toxin [Opitutales bacterium]